MKTEEKIKDLEVEIVKYQNLVFKLEKIIEARNNENDDLKNKLKKRAKQFNDSTDSLKETIRSKYRDIQVIELERDRTEDKYNTLYKLLLDATKIGLNN